MSNQQISPDDALLIVCKALNPFVDAKLLVGGKPVPGAAEIQIGKTMKTLLSHDQQNNEHAVDFLLHDIVKGVQEKGFSLALGKGELVNDFDTIGELADEIVNSSISE